MTRHSSGDNIEQAALPPGGPFAQFSGNAHAIVIDFRVCGPKRKHPFALDLYSGVVSLMKPSGKRALDRILDSSFVADLPELPLEVLRARREEAEREEAWLSYVRRMLHGRIDILQGGGLMNASGELDIDALVASLSGQMGPGQHVSPPDVVESPGGGRRAVERLIASAGLDDPATLSNEEREQRLEQLREMEREVSEARSGVHTVQDLLTAELTRRYRDGEARADGTLRGGL
jgi:hypothetical protein